MVQLLIRLSENNTLHVRWHLFHQFLFLFTYFIFLLPDTDVIMKLLQYIVYCITHSFQL